MLFTDLTHKNLIFKWIFINLHQTPKIFMHMVLSILCFKLACAKIDMFYFSWHLHCWRYEFL